MTSTASSTAALTYEEPHIDTILVQSSLLLVLHVANRALDRLLYCGPVGQILVGVAWGTPGGKLLSVEAEEIFVQLGYLGLILIVFEGGLSTSLASARANWARSTGVAITGIAAPIGLSYILAPMAGATPLQCFAAGAALCSTSLGTMFTVLRASGLTTTRLGVVLASAAMLDDVVGLVMVQVIANLGGGSNESVSWVTIVRPVLVSVAFAVVSVLGCLFMLKPTRRVLSTAGWAQPDRPVGKLLANEKTALVVCTLLLVSLVTGASYAGTSNLFAAYIAGAVLSWWADNDGEEVPANTQASAVPVVSTPSPADSTTPTEPMGEYSRIAQLTPPPDGPDSTPVQPTTAKMSQTDPVTVPPVVPAGTPTGVAIFDKYYLPALKWVLQPLFFASIGFSIPITRMFSASIVWRGVVYGVLMCLGKLLCGVWLLRLPSVPLVVEKVVARLKLSKKGKRNTRNKKDNAKHKAKEKGTGSRCSGTDTEMEGPTTPPRAVLAGTDKTDTAPPSPPSPPIQHTTPEAPAPFSLYPAAILGLAMVPRGEIGFLISSVAESNGVFGGDAGPVAEGRGHSDVFLVVTWAIVLCTVFGPPAVGLLVKRVKRLSAGDPTSTRNPLGVWGL
ncbi:hypothetical protein SEUCBS139899_002900 [Sporothrix eucalyptigena]